MKLRTQPKPRREGELFWKKQNKTFLRASLLAITVNSFPLLFREACIVQKAKIIVCRNACFPTIALLKFMADVSKK